MTDFAALLQLLVRSKVDFVIVGGIAAAAHGSARSTNDLDVVYSRKPENVHRLSAALSAISPYLRGAPPGLPFRLDVETILRGLNFTLTTTLGDIDLLGEITGGGTYEELVPHSIPIRVFDVQCLCLGLEWLIQVKRAAGRPRDLEVIAELEALRDAPRG